MKLIYEITVFSLISTLSLYLLSNIFGEVLIRGQRFKEGGHLFQGNGNTSYQISKFVFVLFNNENETQNLKIKKKKKKLKHQNMNNSFIL